MTPESPSSQVQLLLKAIVERRGIPVLFVSAFGHTIDTAFWIGVATDEARSRLKADPTLAADFDFVFRESGYLDLVESQWKKNWERPQFTDADRAEMAHLKKPSVEIDSQESCDREQGGNWWHRMK